MIPEQGAVVLPKIVSHGVEECNRGPEESSKRWRIYSSRYRLLAQGGGPREGATEAHLSRGFIHYGSILCLPMLLSYGSFYLSCLAIISKSTLCPPHSFLFLPSLARFCALEISILISWHPVFCKINIPEVLANSSGHLCTSSFLSPSPICLFASNSSQMECGLTDQRVMVSFHQGQVPWLQTPSWP